MSLSAPINPLIFPCCIGAEGPSPASCAVSFQPPHLHLTLTRLPSCQSSRDVFDRIFACHHYMEACRAWKWGCNIFLGRHRHPKKNAVRGKAYCRVVESVIEKSSIDAIWIVCVHTRNQNWIVLLWLADTGCQEKERMYESVSIFTMYDRQATTFLSHRLGAGAGAAALQSLWPSPPQLHWRSGRLQWCLNPTGSDPWRHARSTAGGVAFMARCGRKKKAHNWQGVSCVMIMSLAFRWACPSFTPFNQHFLSFLVISSLFLNSNRHFRFQDLESVPSWVPWWVAWWGLQASGFLPRPPTRRWAGHLASLGQCEVGQLGLRLGMDWAYRSSNLRWKWVLCKTLLARLHIVFWGLFWRDLFAFKCICTCTFRLGSERKTMFS